MYQYFKITNSLQRWHLLGGLLMLLSCRLLAQQQLMEVDTSRGFGKNVLSMYRKFEHVRLSGYIQPQFQIAQTRGAKIFNGGDFAPNSNNRFTLRRGRLRFDYARFSDGQPSVFFVFQFDGSERGVFIRDFWGRFYENRWHLFSFTTGMFARPFGFEVNTASPDRESPERGRMSQLLMRVERDLGAMVSFEPRTKNHPLRHFRLDAGLFNGQGLNATTDFDSHKDLITRLVLKPHPLRSKVIVSGSFSALVGGMEQFTKQIYRMRNGAFVVDSAASNLGKIAPRHYWGADVQIKFPNRKGFTELRAEYTFGTQTATAITSETPGAIPTNGNNQPIPLYVRHFDGAYFYFLQHLGSEKHQLTFKYDFYDPNKDVSKKTINQGFTWADIRYNTWGVGYIYYINENLKLLLWYENPINESTSLSGYTQNIKDNNFTSRIQYRF